MTEGRILAPQPGFTTLRAGIAALDVKSGDIKTGYMDIIGVAGVFTSAFAAV